MALAFRDLYLHTQSAPFYGTLLALDPGETTGYAIFYCVGWEVRLIKYGQLPCTPLEKGIEAIREVIKETQQISSRDVPACDVRVVYEDYKVYAWKANAHSWESLHTPQLIGCIRMACKDNNIPVSTQMAQQPKGFVTDEKLHQWGFYQKGVKHARDAIRHGLYYLLCTHKKMAS